MAQETLAVFSRWDERRRASLIYYSMAGSEASSMLQAKNVSAQTVHAQDIICLDHLAVKGGMANHKLAKAIADAGWGTFVRLVQNKAGWNEKRGGQNQPLLSLLQDLSRVWLATPGLESLGKGVDLSPWPYPGQGRKRSQDILSEELKIIPFPIRLFAYMGSGTVG